VKRISVCADQGDILHHRKQVLLSKNSAESVGGHQKQRIRRAGPVGTASIRLQKITEGSEKKNVDPCDFRIAGQAVTWVKGKGGQERTRGQGDTRELLS